jgi:hypothetical protein
VNMNVFDETTYEVASVTLGGIAEKDAPIAYEVLHHYMDAFKERLEVLEWLYDNTPGWQFEASGPGHEGPKWAVYLRFKTPADASAFRLRWM